MPMHESSCIEDPSFFFRSLSSLLSVSVIVHWLSSLFRCTHTVAQVWVSVHPIVTFMVHAHCERCFCSLRLLPSLHLLIISLITLLFLMPDIFNFLNVVDKYPAYFRWGPWHPGREWLLHRSWAQRPLHHGGLCRIHPGVPRRATVPWWLRLRWRHHRSDAPSCVPKTSRSLWRRRRPVVLSVVVSQSWWNGKTRCFAVT